MGNAKRLVQQGASVCLSRELHVTGRATWERDAQLQGCAGRVYAHASRASSGRRLSVRASQCANSAVHVRGVRRALRMWAAGAEALSAACTWAPFSLRVLARKDGSLSRRQLYIATILPSTCL